MPFPPKLATPPPHQAKVEARRDYLYRQLQNRVAGLARSLLKSRRGAPPSYEALVTATEALCVKHRVIGYDHVLRSICLSLWHREHTQFGGFR
jgi:hypothetical protein